MGGFRTLRDPGALLNFSFLLLNVLGSDSFCGVHIEQLFSQPYSFGVMLWSKDTFRGYVICVMPGL